MSTKEKVLHLKEQAVKTHKIWGRLAMAGVALLSSKHLPQTGKLPNTSGPEWFVLAEPFAACCDRSATLGSTRSIDRWECLHRGTAVVPFVFAQYFSCTPRTPWDCSAGQALFSFSNVGFGLGTELRMGESPKTKQVLPLLSHHASFVRYLDVPTAHQVSIEHGTAFCSSTSLQCCST